MSAVSQWHSELNASIAGASTALARLAEALQANPVPETDQDVELLRCFRRAGSGQPEPPSTIIAASRILGNTPYAAASFQTDLERLLANLDLAFARYEAEKQLREAAAEAARKQREKEVAEVRRKEAHDRDLELAWKEVHSIRPVESLYDRVKRLEQQLAEQAAGGQP